MPTITCQFCSSKLAYTDSIQRAISANNWHQADIDLYICSNCAPAAMTPQSIEPTDEEQDDIERRKEDYVNRFFSK